MSDDEVYSDSFDTDDDEPEATSSQTNVNANKAQKKCAESDMQATNLHDLFNGTLVLLKIVEAYSIEHARDWRAPTNMLEMLQLVQKVVYFQCSISPDEITHFKCICCWSRRPQTRFFVTPTALQHLPCTPGIRRKGKRDISNLGNNGWGGRHIHSMWKR